MAMTYTATAAPPSLRAQARKASVAAALARKGPVPKERLFREALKVHLGLSGRPKSEIDEALEKHGNLDAALGSAVTYLREGDVIEETVDGTGWQLVAGFGIGS